MELHETLLDVPVLVTPSMHYKTGLGIMTAVYESIALQPTKGNWHLVYSKNSNSESSQFDRSCVLAYGLQLHVTCIHQRHAYTVSRNPCGVTLPTLWPCMCALVSMHIILLLIIHI